MKKRSAIVTIGGGTGTYVVLSGLKKYKDLSLAAVVAMTDSGGSTGKLRDEFGYLPVGDLRQCLVALAQEVGDYNLLREVFNYRFQRGGAGLEGHSLGNLLLTALTDILGSEEKAILEAKHLLNINGEVIPATLNNVDIVIQQSDGTVTVGETNIKDHYKNRDINSPITKAWLQPHARLSDPARKKIGEADLVIIGPGGLYTSIVTNLLLDDMKKTLHDSPAKILYIANLMTDAGQSHNLTAKEHVEVISKYAGRVPDYILINNNPIPEQLISKYKEASEYLVEDNLSNNLGSIIIRENLTEGSGEITKQKDFGAKRSLVRHNSELIAKAIYNKVLH